MFLFHGIAALLAKVASASTVAQATAGLGIAVAGVTGAGAAGVLPGPVQDGVANTVEAVTPFDLPHSVDDRISGVDNRHEATGTDDSTVDGPASVPTVPVVTTSVAAPTSGHEETEAEDHAAEHSEDGTQHRGGRSTTGATPASSDTSSASDDSAVRTPEVEEHRGGDDQSGHGGDDGSGHHSGDDSSGHGGGDD